MNEEHIDDENLAQTLAREMRKPILDHTTVADLCESDHVLHLSIPKGYDYKQIDLEQLLPNPRRTKAVATLNDADSFLAYVARHASPQTVCWAKFNPQTFTLAFTAVIDEHDKTAAGWRAHVAHAKWRRFDPRQQARDARAAMNAAFEQQARERVQQGLKT